VGFSLGEILLLVIVGIIVVGPKNLPSLMRTAGQWVAKLRRMSMDLRSQSGIDDLIRQEGLSEHIHELRSLSRLNVVETLIAPVAAGGAPATAGAPSASPRAAVPARPWTAQEPLREREYPIAGCDAYGALPDDATPYIPPDITPPKPTAADEPAATATAADAPAADAPAPAEKTEDEAPAAAAIEAPAPSADASKADEGRA
jgi:sec-independent protein translocase protein TatB